MAVGNKGDSGRNGHCKSGRLRFWSCGDLEFKVMSGWRRQDVEGGLVDQSRSARPTRA